MMYCILNRAFNSILFLHIFKPLILNIFYLTLACADENHHVKSNHRPNLPLLNIADQKDGILLDHANNTKAHCMNCTRTKELFSRGHTLRTRVKIGGYIFLATLFLGVSWYTITYYLGKLEIQRDPWKYQSSIRRELVQPPERL